MFFYDQMQDRTTESVTGQVVWRTASDGNLKVSAPYSEGNDVVTEVSLSPGLIKQIKYNKMGAQTASLIASLATLDVESAKKVYAKDWNYFSYGEQWKKIKAMTGYDWIASALAQATSMLADGTAAACMTKVAESSGATSAMNKNQWFKFKIVSKSEAKKNSRLYPDWAYVYVKHAWGGICTQDLGVQACFKKYTVNGMEKLDWKTGYSCIV
ncbi:MAG: hypothetical protein V1802_01165 [Candidatus Aenigmatarchaeota archaeon]